MKVLDDPDLHPFQKDYYIKQFVDANLTSGEKYLDKTDNFAYVRCTEGENKTTTIIESLLSFFIKYPEFTQRTGIGFAEMLAMDPSTTDQIRECWAELMLPEEKQNNEIMKLQEQLKQMQSTLQKK